MAVFVLLGFIIQPLSAIGYAERDTDPPRISSRSVEDVQDTDPPRIGSRSVEDQRDTDPPRISLGASGEAEEEPAPTYTEQIDIATAVELTAFAQRVNGGDRMKDMLVTLTADIELDPQTPWVPIGSTVNTPFAGTFDGGGFTVSGIKVEEDMEGGLFGYLYEATIQNVYLKNVDAPNSVSGLYFHAVRSTITDCAKKWGPFALFTTGISRNFVHGQPDIWDGVTLTPFPLSPTIEINSAAKLAQVANMCSSGVEDFDGHTLLLSVNVNLNNHPWTPIGTAAVPFKGRFYGQGCVIDNMNVTGADGGLFGYLADGAVSNLVVTNATVNPSGPSGIIARESTDASISGVVVKDSSISATEAAGILHHLKYSSAPAAISQCVVMDTTIDGGTHASGICHFNENYAITQCAVYRGSLTATISVNGIAQESHGPANSYSGVNQNIVIGTDFSSASDPSGIITQCSGWNSAGNSFVSDVTMPANGVIGTDSQPYGVEYFFTDSRLPINLLNPAPQEYVKNSYWDASTVSGPGRTPLNPTYGHAAYKTSFLTSGQWVPNETYWEAKESYYPYLKFLMNSQTPYMKDITGLTSVAAVLDDPEQSLDDAKEIRLVKRTASGAPIQWHTGDPSASNQRIEQDGNLEITDDGDSLILWVKDDYTFDLYAETETTEANYSNGALYKRFGSVTLNDSILLEDKTERHPSAAEMLSPLPTGFVPSLTFLEPIRINPDARGMIRLFTIRTGGKFLDKALPCDSANMVVTSSGSTHLVEFPTLGLQAGMEYELTIPAGALEEIEAMPPGGPMGNYNEEVVFTFEIETPDAPILNVPATINLHVNSPLSLSDVEGWFQYSNYSDSPVKNQLATPVTDPRATLSSLPVGLHYYIDPALLGSSRSVGTSVVHYFAVTSKGPASRATTVIEVDGLPEWSVEPPVMLHTNWTNNQNTIKALVADKSRATYTSAMNVQRDVAVDIEVDPADWALAMTSAIDGPSAVKVASYMVDTQGNRVLSSARETMVYMDKVLRYDFNTGAIRIRWEDRTFNEWKEVIEEEIAFRALNFAETANVTYDHGKNNYDEEKVYTVTLKTARQIVTLCDGDPNGAYPCSAENHAHLKDKVELKFTVKITAVELPEERNFWQKLENELFVPEYSEFNVTATRKPQLKIPEADPHIDADDFFEMPVSIVEALRMQPYNSLELDYSAYKWKLYGHALESIHERQEIYPLKVKREDIQDHLLGRKLSKDIPAVMLSFDYVGHMHGRVEFFYDLRLAGGLSEEQIAETEFYLYRYNRLTGMLTPAADVQVGEDGWASMVLTELEDTEYVVTDFRFGGEKYNRYIGYGSDDDEPVDIYYHGANSFAANLSMFELDPREEVEIDPALPFSELDTQEMAASAGPSDTEAPVADAKANNARMLFIAIAAGILAAAGGAVIAFKRRKGKGA